MKGAKLFYVLKYKGNRNESPLLFISEHTCHMAFSGISVLYDIIWSITSIKRFLRTAIIALFRSNAFSLHISLMRLF